MAGINANYKIRDPELEKAKEIGIKMLKSSFGVIPLGKYIFSKWQEQNGTHRLNSTIATTSDFVTTSSQDLTQKISNYSNNCGNSPSTNLQNNSNNYSFRSGIKKLGVGLASTAIISTSVLAGMEAAQINNGNEQTKQRLEQLVDTGNVPNYLEKIGDFYF